MAYQVLARKYRPQRFVDVAGQQHVTVTLINALTQGRIAHGYIFSGHRGIGKTTIARILASALNCRNPIGSPLRPTAEPCEVCESCLEIRAGNAVDVIEIDAATNRGIDEIRELRDAARYRPARDKYKIYILDEAHQITDAAFNALLKTLEEPPDHIVFMMATTQPEDIPQTVRSRCQHFSFHAVKLVDILSELRGIADREGVDADDASLNLLAEAGDGSMRDALSIMDQAIASAPVEPSADGSAGRPVLDASQIRELMGTVPNAVFERILEAVDANRSADVITVANGLLDSGNSPAQLARQFVRYLRNCVIAKIANIGTEGTHAEGAAAELLQISPDEQRRAGRSAALFSEEELTRFLQVMLRTFDELGYRQEQRFHFELGLLKLVHLRRLLPIEEVLSQFPVSATPASARNPSALGSSASNSPDTRSRASVSPQASVRPMHAPAAAPPVAPSKPAFSPFATDTNRKRFDEPTPPSPAPPAAKPAVAAPAATVQTPAATPPPPAPQRPLEVPTLELLGVDPLLAGLAEPETPAPAYTLLPEEPEPTPEPETTPADLAPPPTDNPTGTPTAEDLQRAAVEALTSAKSQGSAADALADAEWSLDGSTLRIQTELSKTMLPMVINPDADKLLRQALRTHGAGAFKLELLPGLPAEKSDKKKKSARSGSAQAKAMEHPVVQQAQRLFQAEIRNVIDLSETK